MKRRAFLQSIAAVCVVRPTLTTPPPITVVARVSPPSLMVAGQRIAVDVVEITAFGDHWRRYMPGKRSNRER